MDKVWVAALVRELLCAIGEDPTREGLLETPTRVAKMFEEIFEGIKYTNDEIATMFDKTFEEDNLSSDDYNDMVIVKDIECFSYCEHHLALMYNLKISVAYLPAGRVIGLSKIARIADMVCRRLQLQERIGKDIADIIEIVTGSSDVAVIIEGEHSCMTARGIKKTGTKTRTSTLRGKFQDNGDLRTELMLLI